MEFMGRGMTRDSCWREGSLLYLGILSFLMNGLHPGLVGAEDYYVGSGFVYGWTNSIGAISNSTLLSQGYAEWASSVNISVGDRLVFDYDDLHTVVLIPTIESFNSCSIGSDAVTVSSPDETPTYYNVTGTRPLYFVCSVDSHCLSGQKVAVTNIKDAGYTNTPSSQSPQPGADGAASARLDGLQLSFFGFISVPLILLFVS